MPRPKANEVYLPKYRLHRPSGQAVVTLNGRDHYLGEFNTPQSRSRFQELLSRYLAGGGTLGDNRADAQLTVDELIVRFLDTYVVPRYRRPDGSLDGEVDAMRVAFRTLQKLYGSTAAAQFDTMALEAIQSHLCGQTARHGQTLSRVTVNKRVAFVKRLFKWAARRKLVPAEVYEAVDLVEGLRAGRSGARETRKPEPVPDEHVNAVLPFMPPTLRAMVELHRLTGMRSGELLQMRWAEVDQSRNDVWLYRPAAHKTGWRGHSRVVCLGPKCQELLRPLLSLEPEEHLFSPARVQQERIAERQAKRKRASRAKVHPKKTPGLRYDSRGYYHAVRFAMKRACKAGALATADLWHPHQLRNSAALRIRREHGIEAARAFLGHRSVQMTEHYAGLDIALATETARNVA